MGGESNDLPVAANARLTEQPAPLVISRKEKGNVKKTLFILAGLAALGSLGYFGMRVSGQGVTPAAATTQDKPTLKIGVINVAKVLKNYDKANYLGEVLLTEAKAKDKYIQDQLLALQGEERKIEAEADKAKREAMMKDVGARKLDLDNQAREYKAKFSEKQADMAVGVNKEINAVIDSIVKTYKLELVLTYPGVIDDAERDKAPDAFRRLSTPAVMVAWAHPGLDMTDTVIATLNKYFPKPAGAPAATGVPGTTNK